jgi:hypothetical protein
MPLEKQSFIIGRNCSTAPPLVVKPPELEV